MSNELVSTCCGSSFEESVRQCGECGSLDIGEHFYGDEGWTICGGCEAIEGSEDEVNVCENCDAKKFAQKKGVERKQVWNMSASSDLPIGKL